MTNDDARNAQLEIHHLEQTIRELRAELEKKNLEIERRVQAARQTSNERTKQLEETIDRMRDALEKEHGSREAQIQAVTRSLKDQLQQAQQTILAMREQLEQIASR